MLKNACVGFLILIFTIPQIPKYSPGNIDIHASTPYELIEEVNELRISNGLTPYSTNPILMNIAQQHAEYMASIGTWTHTGQDGSRPYQRALAAGYPVAGDLSLGGWFSENVTFGIEKTAQDAVIEWQGDAPHLNTMLSPTLRDIGAGVAVIGNTYYYVIDCGLSTGGTPVSYTPPPYLPTGTLVPNTPAADGSIIHIVKEHDTIFGISLSYGVSPNQIYSNNGLTDSSTIYVGQTIIIQPGYTATPTLPTSTATNLPTATPWPTSTFTPTVTIAAPASPIVTKVTPPNTPWSTVIILIIAIGLAGFLTILGNKKDRRS